MTLQEQRLLVMLNEFLEKTNFQAIHNGDCIEVKELVLVENTVPQITLFREYCTCHNCLDNKQHDCIYR